MVLIRVNQIHHFNGAKRLHKGLIRHREVPSHIMGHVSKLSYSTTSTLVMTHNLCANILKEHHTKIIDPRCDIATKKFEKETTKPGYQVELVVANYITNQPPREYPIQECIIK